MFNYVWFVFTFLNLHTKMSQVTCDNNGIWCSMHLLVSLNPGIYKTIERLLNSKMTLRLSKESKYIFLKSIIAQILFFVFFGFFCSFQMLLPPRTIISNLLSTCISEQRMATGTEAFSFLTSFGATTLLSVFTLIEMIYLKICATPPPINAKRPFPVAIRCCLMLQVATMVHQLPLKISFKAFTVIFVCLYICLKHCLGSYICFL